MKKEKQIYCRHAPELLINSFALKKLVFIYLLWFYFIYITFQADFSKNDVIVQ